MRHAFEESQRVVTPSCTLIWQDYKCLNIEKKRYNPLALEGGREGTKPSAPATTRVAVTMGILSGRHWRGNDISLKWLLVATRVVSPSTVWSRLDIALRGTAPSVLIAPRNYRRDYPLLGGRLKVNTISMRILSPLLGRNRQINSILFNLPTLDDQY